MPKKTETELPDDLQRAIRRTARNGVRPKDVRVEHVVLAQVHRVIRVGLVKARAEGFREAARMVAAKSDLLRGTRGGVSRACTELDLTVRDLMEQANRSRT